MRSFLGFLFCMVIGCGGGTSTANRALYVSAEALVRLDAEIASKYTKRAEEALEASHSIDEYRLAMKPMDDVEQSIRLVRAALFSAQAGLEAGRDSRWSCTVKDLVLAFKELQASVTSIMPSAPYIGAAIDVLGAISTADCED